MTRVRAGFKSKTVATWLAFIGGSFGLHRFYLYGPGDWFAWLHPWPTLIGVYGIYRMVGLGQDDQLAWTLLPVLGLMLAATMLMALIYGLMPDDKWNARYNLGTRQSHNGWGAVIGVVCALFVGAVVLMATIAFSGQRYFEYQIDEAHKISQ